MILYIMMMMMIMTMVIVIMSKLKKQHEMYMSLIEAFLRQLNLFIRVFFYRRETFVTAHNQSHIIFNLSRTG
jgi:ATP/ADP translocase